MILLAIALGGAAGALARYGLAGWVQARLGDGFPAGTLLVNVLGSFAIGVAIRVLDAARHTPELRALIIIGLLGGFTTFSAFSYETLELIDGGRWARAAAYALGSVALGLAAVALGHIVAGSITGRG